MLNERQKLLTKIRALLAKTVENGCTEAEAMSALSMSSAMMDACEVTEADLNELKEEKATVEQAGDMRDPHHIRGMLAVNIAKFTSTKVWTSNNKKKFNFCGLPSDIEFAIWLLETLTSFTQHKLKEYLWVQRLTSLEPSAKRRVINGFVFGCTGRINERLRQLMQQTKNHANKNANALVVIKSELVDRKMKELNLNLTKPRNRGSRIEDGSYEAGKKAGDKASFGRPMGGNQGTLRIGRS